MAGHSHFANIKHKKDNIDKKRSKIFTKLVKDITVATRVGNYETNLDLNPRLKIAVSIAKNYNLPKEKIDNAIKAASLRGNDSINLENIRYNGTFYGNIACIMEVSTDNRNRTISEVRTIVTKNEGKIVDSGGIEFLFRKVGLFAFDKSLTHKTFDEFFEYCLNEDIKNISETEDLLIAECEVNDFYKIYNFFQASSSFVNPIQSEIVWLPNEYVEISEEKRELIKKVEEQLDNINDIENIYWNIKI